MLYFYIILFFILGLFIFPLYKFNLTPFGFAFEVDSFLQFYFLLIRCILNAFTTMEILYSLKNPESEICGLLSDMWYKIIPSYQNNSKISIKIYFRTLSGIWNVFL